MTISNIGCIYFAPIEYSMPADGRLLAREKYSELFKIIGNIFGGKGKLFALPKIKDAYIVVKD